MQRHVATALLCLANLNLHCHLFLDSDQPLPSGPPLRWAASIRQGRTLTGLGTAFQAATALTDTLLTCCVQLDPSWVAMTPGRDSQTSWATSGWQPDAPHSCAGGSQ